MNTTKVDQEIRLKILSEEHIRDAIHCISNTFSQGEPMSESLGITHQEFEYFATLFIKKAALEQMSVVAVNNSEELVGAIINEDYTSEPPAGIEQVSEKFGPISELLESLGERYAKTHDINPGSHYHLFMCGVYPEYAGQQLAQRLIRFSEDLAREKQYRALVCEATGKISQHMVSQRLGFQFVDEINYHDFQYEGQPIFSNIDSVKSCIVYHKSL